MDISPDTYRVCGPGWEETASSPQEMTARFRARGVAASMDRNGTVHIDPLSTNHGNSSKPRKLR